MNDHRYIEVEKVASSGKFIVSEVYRDKKRIKIETEKKEEADVYTVVLYKRLCDEIIDRMNAGRIANYD